MPGMDAVITTKNGEHMSRHWLTHAYLCSAEKCRFADRARRQALNWLSSPMNEYWIDIVFVLFHTNYNNNIILREATSPVFYSNLIPWKRNDFKKQNWIYVLPGPMAAPWCS